MTKEPRNDELKPLTQEDQKAIDDFAKDPETAHPKVDGHPAWQTKETSKWPMYAGFGILFGLTAIILLVSWLRHTPPPEETAGVPTKMEGSGVVVTDVSNLAVGSVYRLSSSISLFVEPVEDVTSASPAVLVPEGSSISVLKTEMKGAVIWYSLKAADKDQKELGTGWIPVKALEGQSLQQMDVFRFDFKPIETPKTTGN